MSTANLRTAVAHTTPAAAYTVGELLDAIAMHASLHLAAAESVAARLAAPDHPAEAADRERADRALDVAVTAHNLSTLVAAVLGSLADDDTTDALDDALAVAVAAAEPAVTAAVRRSLLDAATTDSAALARATRMVMGLLANKVATTGWSAAPPDDPSRRGAPRLNSSRRHCSTDTCASDSPCSVCVRFSQCFDPRSEHSVGPRHYLLLSS